MPVSFLYDVVCPWAYLASTQIDAVAAQAGETVDWQPVLLGGVFRAIGAPDQIAMSAPRTVVADRDLRRWAERLGVPLKVPDAHPRRTVEAMRLCVAAKPEVRPAISAALFRAYWVDGRDITRRDVLGGIAREHGVSLGAIDDAGAKQALFAATEAAAARGVFGVPTFFVGERMFWGLDRLPFVQDALGVPRATPAPATNTGKVITFFHDFSSPFSYLAHTRLAALAARHGATVEAVPFLLGALFRDIGTPDVPMLAMNAKKQSWVLRDLQAHADAYGVPFRYASTFPLRTVTPLRVATLDPSASDAIYRAAWVDDRNIGDDAVLREVLSGAGLDAGLVERASEPATKDALRANGDRARAAGVCGVPSFQVDGRLVFGQDRLDHVEALVEGWQPVAG